MKYGPGRGPRHSPVLPNNGEHPLLSTRIVINTTPYYS